MHPLSCICGLVPDLSFSIPERLPPPSNRTTRNERYSVTSTGCWRLSAVILGIHVQRNGEDYSIN